jgi:selenocysteine-specific elongation factor
MPHIIVGTAGHIDHGKTALVKALTGIDADRLKEEKERGITIDIGFANLAIESDTTIGFIDVPGHERFIKNMLAGVGGIDLVMLVIAADESVMPQTREHLDICSLLHIKQGFTVLTKIDNVDREFADMVEEEVREFLRGSFLENSPILRVSSVTHEGLLQLLEILRHVAKHAQPKDASQIFRLPIDRCFTMKGFGTVVTGTLIAGRVRKDDEVEIFPDQRLTRVRGIQVHGRAATEAQAGQRTALNLQGIDVGDIRRGMVLTVPGAFTPTSMFDCHVELLPSAPNDIQIRKRVRFHVGTSELMGYVVLLGQDRLEPGRSAIAQIRLDEPTFALPGDRFIIRQYSPMTTIGGGVILDAHPEKHRRSDRTIVEKLQLLKDGSLEERLIFFIDEAGLAAIGSAELVRHLGMAPATVHQRLTELEKTGRVQIISDSPLMVVSARAFHHAMQEAVAEVKRFHQANPLVQGISREELKARVLGDAPHLVFQAILDRLISDKKVAASQEVIHEFGRKITLRGDEANMRDQIIHRFRALGLQVPPPDELINSLKLPPSTAKKVLQLLVKENVLVKISEDMVLHRESVEKLVENVRRLKAKNPKLGVGEFKDLTGVSRKYAIPLLEYLDRQKVTRRVGDERVIL